MGILTSLKGMGAGMKHQLNQLALNFNNNASHTSSRGGAARMDEEARPLTGQDYEEVREGLGCLCMYFASICIVCPYVCVRAEGEG